MNSLITIEELIQCRLGWSQSGSSVAFVPTMGALHRGHMQLVSEARKTADKVMVSIFVNPTQFGPGEDFATYPRTLKADVDLLEKEGVDAVFMPNATDVYPAGFQTFVSNDEMSQQLCGLSRPGHFRGVLTVVLKLFNLVQPDYAVFGKKDYQQWRLIETMVRDLAVPVKVIGSETLREDDGLAMSSRNRRLSSDDRAAAVALYQGLMAAKAGYEKGERSVEALKKLCRDRLTKESQIQVEYVELCAQDDLKPVTGNCVVPVVLLLAAKLGDVRLIDNMELGLKS